MRRPSQITNGIDSKSIRVFMSEREKNAVLNFEEKFTKLVSENFSPSKKKTKRNFPIPRFEISFEKFQARLKKGILVTFNKNSDDFEKVFVESIPIKKSRILLFRNLDWKITDVAIAIRDSKINIPIQVIEDSKFNEVNNYDPNSFVYVDRVSMENVENLLSKGSLIFPEIEEICKLVDLDDKYKLFLMNILKYVE